MNHVHPEYQYLSLAQNIMENGSLRSDRTGVGTKSLFGYQMRFNLADGFPLLTTKFVPLRLIFEELMAFLHGETNIEGLVKKNVHIWTDWPYKSYRESEHYQGETMEEFSHRIATDSEFAAKHGNLGPVYGAQWRSWIGADGKVYDQLLTLLKDLVENPHSRRHIINGWKVDALDQMALPPCHTLFQFYVADNKLSCQLYQRSGDVFLGIPFNIASYALLTHMIAHCVGLEPGEFIHTIGDAHIYTNHFDQVKTQLQRTPYAFPKISLNPNQRDLLSFEYSDVTLHEYEHHPSIKGDVAV